MFNWKQYLGIVTTWKSKVFNAGYNRGAYCWLYGDERKQILILSPLVGTTFNDSALECGFPKVYENDWITITGCSVGLCGNYIMLQPIEIINKATGG